jgi:hypothetical protein
VVGGGFEFGGRVLCEEGCVGGRGGGHLRHRTQPTCGLRNVREQMVLHSA